MAQKAQWTLEMEFFLIDLVKERRVLWDPRSRGHRKKTIKHFLYTEIAETMGGRWPESCELFEPSSLQKKFRLLKLRYRTELGKDRQVRRYGCHRFVSSWPHFYKLAFLRRNVDPTCSPNSVGLSQCGNDYPDISSFCEPLLKQDFTVPSQCFPTFSGTNDQVAGEPDQESGVEEASSSTQDHNLPDVSHRLSSDENVREDTYLYNQNADKNAEVGCDKKWNPGSENSTETPDPNPEGHFTRYLRDKLKLSNQSPKKDEIKAEIVKHLISFACDESLDELDSDERFAQCVGFMLSMPTYGRHKDKLLAEIVTLLGRL